MSASTHLAQFGVTLQQARDFVFSNVNNPGTIYAVSKQFGVTNEMLAEIVGGGFTAQQVSNFFTERGFDGPALGGLPSSGDESSGDGTSGGGGSGGDSSGGGTTPPATDTDTLVPAELQAVLSALVTPNTRTGILSNAELRAAVLSQGVSQAQYNALFSPASLDDNGNGTLELSELGLTSGASFAATSDTLESLVYGSMLNLLERIDLNETLSLSNFVQTNAAGLEALNPTTVQQYVNLLVGVFDDVANPPLLQGPQLRDSVVLAVRAAVIGVSGDNADALESLFSGLVGL